MAESPPNLRSIFLSAKAKEAALQQVDGLSTTNEEDLQTAISMFEDCRRLIERLAMFSPNETSEDIGTHTIQYLGVDYLLAELLLKTYGPDRQKLLRQASELLETFLTRLDAYELLSKQNKRLLGQYQDNLKAFQWASVTDAAERRRIKVTRFQQEKDLKAKLELLRNKSGQNSADEEVTRQLYFTELEIFASQSFQSLDMIAQENAILSEEHPHTQHTSQSMSDSRQNGRSHPDDYSERLDPSISQVGHGGPLLSKEGKPLQPFTITGNRSQVRQGVFRPGHTLPTMTIEDYLEEEKRRGGIIDGGGPSDKPAAEPDEDNMEASDLETLKARAWDEYTEENPKGSGNTMNRG